MRNLIIVATMFVLGLGQASILINDASSLTGMSLAAVVGIVLNLVLPEEKTVSSEENTVKKSK
jgi:uracil permease